MDDSSGLCLGCGRTRSEIAAWKDAREEERSRIWKELPARRASLGLKTHRLGWSIEDIRAFILSTLKPGNGTWVSGIYGAVAEFCIGDKEDIAFDIRELGINAKTWQGAISFHLTEHVCAFSIGVAHAPADGNVILFAAPRGRAAIAVSQGLISMAQDEEAIRPESSNEILFDFGLGTGAAGFGIRTADSDLVASLSRWIGETHPHFLTAAGKGILQASPTRVVRNAIGRIEVFAPIPLPGERSPARPHTHYLPEHLAQGGDLPPNLQIPEAYVPCFLHYPPRLRARMGNE